MSDEFDFAAAAAIRKVAEDWAVLRDSGRWEDFARVWHDDGWMTAGTAPAFPVSPRGRRDICRGRD